MAGTSGPDSVSTKQQRIAELAQQAPQMAFTSLNHYLSPFWMLEAYHRTRKDAAPGVDGQTAEDYRLALGENLAALLERAKAGTYRAPPVRRVYILKGTGPETRPLGIPTLEDKILQRAIVMVLEPIYEHDFYDCSFGFRPGRSAHQAMDVLRQQIMALGGCWLVEVDIRKFFDTLDHGQLRALLHRRIRDGVVLRLIGKWLRAGILEDGSLTYPEAGTPQGGVISPLLANVYLHYVLDDWFEQEVKPRLLGRAFLVRYADDFVMGFACEEDARRVLEVLPKRFGKYGLTLHPSKTRLVPFQRPGRGGPAHSAQTAATPGSFDFLGMTWFWSRSRQGYWVVKRTTAQNRFQRALGTIAQWCRRNLHQPIADQHRALGHKLLGHFQYYGVIGNGRSLWCFRHRVIEIWKKWLSRRGGKKECTWSWVSDFLGQVPFPSPPGWVQPHVANP